MLQLLLGIEEPLLLNGIITIISSSIESLEVSHLILCDIFSNADKYIALNKSNHKKRLYVFKVLLSFYLPKTYQTLDRMKALDDHYLNLMFIDFFITLLPRKVLLLLLLLLLLLPLPLLLLLIPIPIPLLILIPLLS